MATKIYDCIVIGAGPGGYVAAIRAAQLGLKTLVVEKDELGGVCLNRGCIPSKALICAARKFTGIREMKNIGISVGETSLDFTRTQAWKQRIVKRMSSGIEYLFKGNGVEFAAGEGKIRGQGVVEVTNQKIVETYSCSNIIVATGSVSMEIPGIHAGGRIIDSTGALSLPHIPRRLLIIGGGYIGLELGNVYANFGSEVTVVELMDQVLPGFDRDVVDLVMQKLKRNKIRVFTSSLVKIIEEIEDGHRLRVSFCHKDTPDKMETVEVDYAVLSVGRKPNPRGIGLEELGVEIHGSGFIKVDRHMQTSIPGIYAIGDVAGQPMLAHKASMEGEVAAEVIAGHSSSEMDYRIVPAVAFIEPEVAVVGYSESEAKKLNLDYITGRFPYSASGKAWAMTEPDGFVKILASRDRTKILGVTIAGAEASSLIGEAALAMKLGATLHDIARTIHPHPTLTEVFMEASKQGLGEAIHVINTVFGE